MRNQILFAVLTLGLCCSANAKMDGSDIPECAGVTDACMNADISNKDSKSGKVIKGYQPGEHKGDAHGLWVDCVHKLAKGATVAGVSGVPAAKAQACMDAEKRAHGRGKASGAGAAK